MQSVYLDAIRKFEGFTPKAQWDYAQFTNGYGTRAKFAGETIDRAEADRRFASEISEARAFVETQVPQADEGTKAALTSLTFNAGRAWSKSGLGEAVRAGDLDTARSLFLQYNKAGGETLPGLVARRLSEVTWIGASDGGANIAAAQFHPIPSPTSAVAAGGALLSGTAEAGVTQVEPAASTLGQQRALAVAALSEALSPKAPHAAATGSEHAVGFGSSHERLLISIPHLQPEVASSTALLLHDALARLGQHEKSEER